MVSHVHPWTGVADGGNFGSIYRAPLAERPRASVGGRSGMFISTYVNKVDRKGRVSVPATFRSSLATHRHPNLVIAFPSVRLPALECTGSERMDEVHDRIETLEQFSEEYENLSLLFAEAQQLTIDGEGRVILPEKLKEHAHITGDVAFVGL